ncbi:MAG: glycosyltransferase [Acinetobacter sp.]
MKVLIYFNGRSRLGGVERRITRVLAAIAGEHGIDAKVVFKLYEPEERVVSSYVSILGENSLQYIGCSNYMQVAKCVVKEKPDWIMYTAGYGSMMPFLLAGCLVKAKRLLLSVTTTTSMLKFRSRKEKVLFVMAIKLSTQIDCLYPEATSLLKSRFHKKTITTTPCPTTNLNLFRPIQKQKTIVFLSRWIKEKNPRLFIDAISTIREKVLEHGYRVVMGGNASNVADTDEIKSYIASLHLEDIIVTPGYVEAQDYLPSANMFLSLQDVTNYPSQSLLEAIASGCYIIATNTGETGLLVKENFGKVCECDATSIGEMILRYFEMTNEQHQHIINDARDFAVTHFSMSASTSYFYNILNG